MTNRTHATALYSERDLHRAVAELLGRYQRPGIVWWHTPNGGYRHPVTAAKLMNMGVLPGVPDFVLLSPAGVTRFLELKTPQGRLSPKQKIFRERVTALRFDYAVARSMEQAAEKLHTWGVLKDYPFQKGNTGEEQGEQGARPNKSTPGLVR